MVSDIEAVLIILRQSGEKQKTFQKKWGLPSFRFQGIELTYSWLCFFLLLRLPCKYEGKNDSFHDLIFALVSKICKYARIPCIEEPHDPAP